MKRKNSYIKEKFVFDEQQETKETLIKNMEEKLGILEKEHKKFQEDTQKRFFPSIFVISLVTVFVLSYGITYLFEEENFFISTINTILGPISKATAFTGMCFLALLPGIILLQYIDFYDYKKNRGKEKELQNTISALKKELENQKEIEKETFKKKTEINVPFYYDTDTYEKKDFECYQKSNVQNKLENLNDPNDLQDKTPYFQKNKTFEKTLQKKI